MNNENHVTFAEYIDERERITIKLRNQEEADAKTPTILPEDYEEYVFPDGTRLRAPKITRA